MDSKFASRSLLAQLEAYLLPVPLLLGFLAREHFPLYVKKLQANRTRTYPWGREASRAECSTAQMARRETRWLSQQGPGRGGAWRGLHPRSRAARPFRTVAEWTINNVHASSNCPCERASNLSRTKCTVYKAHGLQPQYPRLLAIRTISLS